MADYTKFTVASKKDTSSGAYSLEDYDKDLRRLRNAIKSALPEDTDFSEGNKSVARSGRMSQAFYVPAEYATQIGKMLRAMNQKLLYDGGDKKYSVTRARQLNVDDKDFLKSEERKREDKERSAEATATKSVILKIIAILTTIADITRRILSSVLTMSTKTVKEMTEAHNLGLSYDYVRKSRYIETSRGLKEGTITNAIADVQNKFGNITELDEDALNKLALVMGSKVEDLVKSGIGVSDPDKLLGSILDTFNEKANAGYNSVGQYVGEQQARRELYSYLLKISPTWADIFATMQEEQHNINSIFRDQADTWAKFRDLPFTRDFGAGQIEYNVEATLGQEWNQLITMVREIKNSIIRDLAPSLLSIVRWFENWRIGLTESQNRKLNKENKQANQAEIDRVEGILSTIPFDENDPLASGLSVSQIAYVMALKDYLKDLKKANEGDFKGNIAKAVLTPDEIRNNAKDIVSDLFVPYKSLQGGATDSSNYAVLRATGATTITTEDMKDIAEAYDIDFKKEKEEFEAEKSAEREKAREKKVEKEVDDKVEAKVKQLEKEKPNYNPPFFSTNQMETRGVNILNHVIRILRSEGLDVPDYFYDTRLEAIDRLRRAYKDGLVKVKGHDNTVIDYRIGTWDTTGDYTPNYENLIDKNKIIEEVENSIAEAEGVDIYGRDESDFINWFAKKYWKLTPFVSALEAKKDRAMEESETGNPLSAYYLAYPELMKAMNSFGAGTYVLSSQQSKTGSGEVELKINLAYTNPEGKTINKGLGSYVGESGYTGVIFNATLDKEGNLSRTDTTAIVGTGASGGASNGR